MELFNRGRFWHAHEAWEVVWLAERGEEREFLQGLIQLAAAYHHLQRGTLRGAVRLFDAALRRLAPFPEGFRRVDRAGAVRAAVEHRAALTAGASIDAGDFPKLGYNEVSLLPDVNLTQPRGEMLELDQRDRELLNALQGDIPLASTPFAFIGQSLDMSEKEVIKRTERLKRDGVVRQVAMQFDPRALGYRSCLVAAHVAPDKIEAAAAVINGHPGVTKNYRRNNELNLWFTVFVSPLSTIGLDKTIDLLGREAGCETVRPLPTLRLFRGSSGADGESWSDDEQQAEYVPLTPVEMECVRILQGDFPLQPRPFDALARLGTVGGDELIATASAMLKRRQIRRFSAIVPQRRSGFQASAMGVWAVGEGDVERAAAKLVQHRAVSHCYLRPVYEDWPYNLYTTVHARSVDECESLINDLTIDAGLSKKETLFPLSEYKRSRINFFGREAEEWEAARAGRRAAAAG